MHFCCEGVFSALLGGWAEPLAFSCKVPVAALHAPQLRKPKLPPDAAWGPLRAKLPWWENTAWGESLFCTIQIYMYQSPQMKRVDQFLHKIWSVFTQIKNTVNPSSCQMPSIKQLMHALPLHLSFLQCNQCPSLVVPRTSHKEEPELLSENLLTGQEENSSTGIYTFLFNLT